MGVVLLGALVASIDTTPKQGASDDRLYALAVQLKCLQCVGESVGASQAPLAVQFRDEITKQMRQGRSDDEILTFFTTRYGQEVLLTPPSTGLGSLVWIIPVVGAAAALLGLIALFRRWRREADAAPEASAADESVVAAALRERHDAADGAEDADHPNSPRPEAGLSEARRSDDD
ncbi:MAG: cytochrome c-type biogenesis protein [Microthrixaceae bacterium]